MFALCPVSHPADGWEGGFVFTLGSDDVKERGCESSCMYGRKLCSAFCFFSQEEVNQVD